MNKYKALLYFVSFLVLVGLACSLTGGGDPTATPVAVVEQEQEQPDQPLQEEEQEQEEPPPHREPTATEKPENTPTKEPEPTQEPPPTATVEAPVDEPLAYFVEEFEETLSGWSWFLISGDENKMDLYTENGYLVFDLQGEDQYVYVLYDEYTYTNVRVDVMAENRGKNTNNVSLICNHTDQFGWYEISVSNGGEYVFWVYSEIDGGYDQLATGGSTNVRMGRDVNTYTAICRENELQLYINGFLEREFVDTRYNLREGQVGVSVSSFDVLPILVNVDYVAISQP